MALSVTRRWFLGWATKASGVLAAGSLVPDGAKLLAAEIDRGLEPSSYYKIYVTKDGTLFLHQSGQPTPEGAYRCGVVATNKEGKIACFHQTVMDDFLMGSRFL